MEWKVILDLQHLNCWANETVSTRLLHAAWRYFLPEEGWVSCVCWNIPTWQYSSLRGNQHTDSITWSPPEPSPQPLHCIAQGPREPLLLVAGRAGNSFNPLMNALVLSQGDIEKMFHALPEQSAEERGPWEVFYSDEILYSSHSQNLRRGILVPYFSAVALTHFHIGLDDII